MDSRNQKENIKEFVRRWSAQTGAEEEQDRSFWIEFMQDCLGVPNATKLLDFQRKVGGRKIDVFYEDMKVLIEQKGKGIDLDKPSVCSKRVGEETPFQQAKWYADNMPNSIRPDWSQSPLFKTSIIFSATAWTTGTATEFPNCLYA